MQFVKDHLISLCIIYKYLQYFSLLKMKDLFFKVMTKHLIVTIFPPDLHLVVN